MAELVSGAVVAQLGPSKCLDLQGDLAAVEMTPSHDAFLSEEGFTVEAWVFAKSEDLRAYIAKELVGELEVGQDARSTRSNFLGPLCFGRNPEVPLEEADKEDLADTLKRRISSSRSEAATCAAKGDSSRMSRFCLVLLLGGAARWEENGRDLLPEGRSFDSLGRPSEVAVAFQQLVQQYQTQLWSASANGELATVRRLLQQFQDPNGRDEQGESAIWKASVAGHVDVVELLLEASADPSAPADGGVTPLFAAAQNGCSGAVRSLLEAKVDSNQSDQHGRTPLSVAVPSWPQVVRCLLEAGADKDKATEDGRTPLFIAAESNHPVVAMMLLEAGAEQDRATEDGRTPLFMAAYDGNCAVVQHLLRFGAQTDLATEDGRTPLLIAAGKGYLDIVRSLLNATCDVGRADRYGHNALFSAAMNGNLAVVQCLLDAGAATHERGRSRDPLIVAAENNHFDVVKALLEHGVADEKVLARYLLQVDTEDDPLMQTPGLVTAAHVGHLGLVKILLEAGAPRDKADQFGRSPLFIAAGHLCSDVLDSFTLFKTFLPGGQGIYEERSLLHLYFVGHAVLPGFTLPAIATTW
ncbi:Ankyrin repeat domain-containing protein 50 [Durusdinium trenchii]|uniref:Ankyrin repeat domain-containing protein 50 n=1 Tax=Durusdinium trenchii TaxID=1381693 RepID=A0ABP0MNN7_9DINO